MSTLTIRIDDDFDAELTRLAAAAHRTKSELVREMLRRQVALEEVQHLRAKLRPYAERAGFLTDEDFFEHIS